MPTTFGTEFECLMPAGKTRAELVAALVAAIGKGPTACQFVEYRNAHQPTTFWKVTTDGSLGDYMRGVEVVSPALPPLQGEEGIAEMVRVCKALTAFGCEITNDCGMHVHVGVADQGLAFFKRIVRLYQTYEPVLDAMMPRGRRANRNNYTRTMTAVSPALVAQAPTINALAGAIQNASRAYEPRYHKVNVVAFNRHKTVEFRHHSGTVDAEKSEMWVRLCMKMVEAAKNPAIVFDTATGSAPRNGGRPGTKVHTVIDMILRDGGASREEIIARVDWPSISIAQIAARNGLNVITSKRGREIRYSISAAATAPTAHDVSINGFCRLIGATDSEQAYMTRRTSALTARPFAA